MLGRILQKRTNSRRMVAGIVGTVWSVVIAGQAGLFSPSYAASETRAPEDEVIYFVLPDRFENGDRGNDRGGLSGGAMAHGFDPTHKGFYHGGDLKGLTERLDYIEGLGATAIWLGPIYKNKPVQGEGAAASSGYHGYWITDFTSVDPHFGDKADMRAFVEAAHARGMKVYLDIITNHTADVIAYRECHDPFYSGDDRPDDGCPYRSKADYPYTTRGNARGAAINDGFLGDGAKAQTPENFKRLTRPDYAYTPFVPEGEEGVKRPAWLNDPVYYHNRGETTFEGENSLYGDFFGLDDLLTEHPRVVDGFIEIYKSWISEFKVDGFRIDTARHVNPEFWQAFVPAILAHADAEGIESFYIFGEVYDPNPATLARFSVVDGFPVLLDFAFQDVVARVLAHGEPSSAFAELFAADALYAGGTETARRAPIFVGNHDMGRFSTFVTEARPDATDEERFKRVRLAHAMMFFLRGAPVIYYGDEQGFVGDGNDQAAREDMFPSKVASYNDNDLIATDAGTATENFDMNHPLYRSIQEMSAVYKSHTGLRRGEQVVRRTELEGGVLAVSRIDAEGAEYLVVFNADPRDREVRIEVEARSASWESVVGSCPGESLAPMSVEVSVPALDYIVCKSNNGKSAE